MSTAIVDTGAVGVRPGDGESATNGEVSTADVVRKLRAGLERYQYRRARRAGWNRRFIPTGLAPLDAVLPSGGLPCGAITEILSDTPGVGAMSLAMRFAARRSAQRVVVFVDTLADFHPPAVRPFNLAMSRLVVLRTTGERDALWAVDQSLRCPGVAAVIAPLTGIDQRQSRRLQLAAESSGCTGLILRPSRRRSHSFAAVRMLVEGVINHEMRDEALRPPLPSSQDEERIVGGDADYLCRITLIAVREGMPTEPIQVNLSHATGAVAVHPIPVDRPAARTG